MDIAIIDAAIGRVVTVVNLESLDGYDPGEGLIARDATGQPTGAGGSWSEGDGFSPPPAPEFSLAERKDAARRAVNAKRDQIIGGGYQHNFGATAGIRTLDNRGGDDRDNWQDLLNEARDLVASSEPDEGPTAPLLIRGADNETFETSAATAVTALVAMRRRGMAVMAYSWTLKDAIAAAADDAALAAIDIDVGWPA